MVKKVKCNCVICGEFIGEYYPSQTRKTCSMDCKNKLNSINVKGKRNPNYKHGKNIENRCKECEKLIDARASYCPKCKYNHYKNPFKGKKHNKQTLKIIGEKSKAKFTPEMKKHMRKVFEERGYWIPHSILSEYKIYYRQCEWDDEVPGTGDFNLVRDHIYSRYDGFQNHVSPLIMKHPVNCQIIKRVENISKGGKSKMTLKELYNKIRKYKGTWSKHQECLNLLPEVM